MKSEKAKKMKKIMPVFLIILLFASLPQIASALDTTPSDITEYCNAIKIADEGSDVKKVGIKVSNVYDATPPDITEYCKGIKIADEGSGVKKVVITKVSNVDRTFSNSIIEGISGEGNEVIYSYESLYPEEVIIDVTYIDKCKPITIKVKAMNGDGDWSDEKTITNPAIPEFSNIAIPVVAILGLLLLGLVLLFSRKRIDMTDTKVYSWIGIGQVIGLVTGVVLKLEVYEDISVLAIICMIGVVIGAITIGMIRKSADAVRTWIVSSITSMIVGGFAVYVLGIIPFISVAQISGDTNVGFIYLFTAMTVGPIAGLFLNATANKSIDKNIYGVVSGIIIGVVIGLLFSPTSENLLSIRILSKNAYVALGAILSIITGAITGWTITKDTDGFVEGAVAGALVSVSVGAIGYGLATDQIARTNNMALSSAVVSNSTAGMINGIIVGMIVGMIVGVNVAEIDNVRSSALFGVVNGGFVGGTFGAIFGEIHNEILLIFSYVGSFSYVGTYIILLFAIIGCILSIWTNIKHQRKEIKNEF